MSRNWLEIITLLVIFVLSLSATSASAATETERFPEFKLTLLDSTEALELKSFKGDIVLIDFWASWCVPCKEAFPFYDKLQKEFQNTATDLKFHVLGVNLDETKEPARKFLKEHPVDFKNVFDEEKKLFEQLETSAIPVTYLLDPKGVIQAVYTGFNEEKKPRIRSDIQTLIMKKRKGSQSTAN